jgi:hypothetical protein
MTTTTQTNHLSTAQWLIVAAQVTGAAIGAVSSYDFGMRISGLPLAVLLAANGAFFGTVMVGCVASLLSRDSGRGSSG